ncbi:hypothetical protein EDF52_10275 [Curtobacterium sp. PhB42]|nr:MULTISPECIES: hypothetical protein [unclassified Curtobacterium]TDW50987.1 hypothetical protein EDF52_10275 [Curtobacterium sp. PhB42]TDW56167.1 hypothetical protein EDF47_104278 [Curtobacterium sp. PhB190]
MSDIDIDVECDVSKVLNDPEVQDMLRPLAEAWHSRNPIEEG